MAKLTVEERRRYYEEALGVQRHLLRTSIDAMAGGDFTQALRIAVSIRTMVHETGMSKPLLKHLQKNYLELPIMHQDVEAKREEHSDGSFSMTITMPTWLTFSKQGARFNTNLTGKGYHHVPLGAWWNGVCFEPGNGKYTRRAVVLWLANKESAHVDADIDEEFKRLRETKYVQYGIGGEQPESIAFEALQMSQILTGRCGVELLDCLDKNFPITTAAATK